MICDCFQYDYGGGPGQQSIDFCPLHASAPKMLEFLKHLATQTFLAGELSDSDWKHLHELIAEAEAKP